MASKARKERRRREREERLREQLAALAIDQQTTQELQHEVAFVDDTVPTMVEVVYRNAPAYAERAKKEFEQHGASYEEVNWARLSPTFRDTHNRLRQLRGMPPIPPPVVDLYKPPLDRRADPKELEALNSEQAMAKAQFLGQRRMMAPGREGFTFNGEPDEL